MEFTTTFLLPKQQATSFLNKVVDAVVITWEECHKGFAYHLASMCKKNHKVVKPF